IYPGGMRFIPVFNAHSYRFDAQGQDTIPASPAYAWPEARIAPPAGYESDNDLRLLFSFIKVLQKKGPCFCKNLDDYTFSLIQFDGRYYTIGFERENASGSLTIDAQGPSLQAMKINARFKSQEYELSAPSEAELFFTPQGFVKEATYIHRWQHPYMTSQEGSNIQHPRPDADRNPCEVRIWWKTCSTQRITLKIIEDLPVLKPFLSFMTQHPYSKEPIMVVAYWPGGDPMPPARYHAPLFDTLPAPDPDFAAVETRLGRNTDIREQYAKTVTSPWRAGSSFTSPVMRRENHVVFHFGKPPKAPERNLGYKLYADMLEKYGK
ncbi:MAG: hypothetical protein IJL93_03310, partial [Bacteroidales bacterium]|nr:hypothetical protein [Bacteroidales bacterium]